MQAENSFLRLSGDQIIDLVQEHRNDLINNILPEGALRSYLSTRLDQIPDDNLELIRRALIELILSPVDSLHYSALLLEIRKKDAAIVSKSSETLFYQDIEKAIKNYIL